jgi:hypothetical protein
MAFPDPDNNPRIYYLDYSGKVKYYLSHGAPESQEKLDRDAVYRFEETDGGWLSKLKNLVGGGPLRGQSSHRHDFHGLQTSDLLNSRCQCCSKACVLKRQWVKTSFMSIVVLRSSSSISSHTERKGRQKNGGLMMSDNG